MILLQFTSYVLVCQLNNFIIYNTHLNAGYVNAFGPEKQDGYTACHHHHKGQNRPHHKTITYPHDPTAPLQKDAEFLGGGEGIVWPPLPTLMGLEEVAKKPLLLLKSKVYKGTEKINKYD